ncbi:MAG: hypothetical protein KAR38_07220, partial [Calditrichia bacterium]|nr:hypothetical protein [Calditrichia bacterium]
MEENLIIKYSFKFENGEEQTFNIEIDTEKLKILKPDNEPAEWTKLEVHQCSECPLKDIGKEYCPAAIAVQPMVEAFGDNQSFEDVEVTVTVPERCYQKKTSLQEGARSMLGILMPVSGCPVLAPLRSMVRFHLPFASSQETLFRAAGSYLIGQYFRNLERKSPDWHLEKMTDMYDEIHKVNVYFARRIHSIIKEDATANSLVILDIFAQTIPF